MKHWLEDIYRDHRRGLLGLALSVVREPASAEDAVHEAFARMVKRPSPPTGDAVAYAYRAVRNAAIDQARRRRARPTPIEDPASLFVTDTTHDPSWSVQQDESQAMLMTAIDNLPDDEREAVVLRGLSGLSYRQIAEATDQPVSTVSSQYQRALGKLRRAMEGTHARA